MHIIMLWKFQVVLTPLATTTESIGTNSYTSSDPIEATLVMNKDATYQYQLFSSVANNAEINQNLPSSGSDTDTTSNEEADSTVSPALSSIGNIDRYITTEMDTKLAKLFDREYIYNNNGTHLNGDIHDNSM